MTPDAFQLAAQRWHDFYLLTGGAAATLTGLMFVAVTFGAGLVSGESAASPRAFIDPTLGHFMQVLGTSALMVMPTLSAREVGVVLAVVASSRGVALGWVLKHMRLAHQAHGDLELSDWMSGIVLPAVAFLVIGGAGIAFALGAAEAPAFTTVGVGTVAVLSLGVRSAWELMIWMAMAMARKKT